MAKGRKSRSSTSRSRRGVSNTANHRLPTPVRIDIRPAQMDLEDLLRDSDRRRFHPDGPHRNARAVFRSAHTLEVPDRPIDRARKVLSHSVAFQAPLDVAICVRRKVRKEVMHATGKAGRRGQKRPHRNPYSDINC